MNPSFVGRGTYFNANDPQNTGFSVGTSSNNQQQQLSYNNMDYNIYGVMHQTSMPPQMTMPMTTQFPSGKSSSLTGFIHEERERNRTMLQGLQGNDPYSTKQPQQYYNSQELQQDSYHQLQQDHQQALPHEKFERKRSSSVFGSLRRLPTASSSLASREPPEQEVRFFNDQEEQQNDQGSCPEEPHSESPPSRSGPRTPDPMAMRQEFSSMYLSPQQETKYAPEPVYDQHNDDQEHFGARSYLSAPKDPVVESKREELDRYGEEDDVAAESMNESSQLEASGAYFKPWKKQTNEEEETPQNKWRSRAIMNPFVKKKAASQKKIAVVAPPDDTNESIPPLSQPVELEPKSARQGNRTPTPPPRNSVKATAKPEDNSLSGRSKSPPHHLRRIRSFGGGKTGNNSPRNNNNDEESDAPSRASSREEIHAEVPPVNPFKRSTALPLRTSSIGSIEPVTEPNQADSTQLAIGLGSLSDRRLPLTKPVRPLPTKAKSKVSTVDALADIKRKREERRVLQAQEKERMINEVKEHGDDAGYKFRRLIQKYRESIGFPTNNGSTSLPLLVRPNSSLTGSTLPPLSTNSGVATGPTKAAAAEINRLSVFIRKRPLAKKELKRKGYDIITCLFPKKAPSSALGNYSKRKELICHEPKLRVDLSETLENHNFKFDGVFDENEQNETIYSQTVGPLVPLLLQNGSITVFAYGQTGSGKTYTMKSIYRQAASEIFEQLASAYENKSLKRYPRSVGVSFYEIYMNNVNDLLNERKRLQLMEDADGLVQLVGLKEVPITSGEELLDLVHQGEDARATSANAVHDDSSRSHALLRITLYADDNMDPNEKLSRLCMVDLAGSERASDTQSDSKNTRMEGAEINKSLLALKECIRALDRGANHVPFRQSKLTQLLRDSFMDTNSKTVMIATISPCSESCNHTLNTLRYADRLKEIGANQ